MKMTAVLLVAAMVAGPSHAALPANTSYTWDSVAIGGGGFVSAVIPSRSEAGMAYARTDVGGAYRWDKAAARWVPLLDWVSENETGYLGVESVAVDPKNAARVYLLAGISYFNGGKTAVLRSSDYGKTFAITDVSAQFKAHGNGMGRQNGEKLIVDPGSSNVLYAGTRWNGLFKSVDAGASWSRVAGLNVTTTPNEAGISFVLADPASVAGGVARRLFVGVSRYAANGPSLYRSDDAGATFTAVAGAPATLMPQRAALDRAGNLYITYANGAGPHGHWSQPEPMDKGQIWKFNFGAKSWSNVTPAGFSTPFSGISVDPANPQRLVASTINTYMQQGDGWGDRIFTSTNGGVSWTDVIARGFVRNAAGVPWLAGHAIHWAGSVEFDPFDTRSVWVTSGNGIFKTANIDAAPATWTFNVKGLEETVPLNLVSIPGGPLVSAIGDYDGFRHSDVTRYAPIHAPPMGTTTGLAMAAANPSRLARAGNAIYTSSDSGATWIKAPVMNGVKGQLALSANGATLLHSPENSATSYRSVNGGASWTPVAGLASQNMRPVADSVNSNKFYAYDNGIMRVSTNGGVSFAAAGTLGGGGSNVIRAAPGREGDIWVALHGGGLVRSTNSGASFTRIAGVSASGAVGFGKADAGAGYPTVYIWGTVNGVRGVFGSTDAGASWKRLNDDAHEYGGPGNGQFVMGDMNTFGVVYMSTAGRGIVVGKPSASTPPPTTPTPVPNASCQYVVTQEWQGGFQAAVRMTNRGATDMVGGWKVNLAYADGSRIGNFWNAAISGSGPYTAVNMSYNATIAAGQTVEFGLTGSSGGARASVPVLSGSHCQQ
jgi:xyloglucan-specific exo-beta-1,4-glucanase